MYFKILGTAAGGGFPQWNCACSGCSAARNTPALKRHHACAALSADGANWYLLNAPPDIAVQIESAKELHAGPRARQTPIQGVILTDAELDHTIGLLVLREQSRLEIFSTNTVQQALTSEFPVKTMLGSYASFRWSTIDCGTAFTLCDGLIRIHPFRAGNKQPRYASVDGVHGEEWVLGVRIEDTRTNRSIVYAPAIEHPSEALSQAIYASNTLFVDGTFWTDNELGLLGVSERTAMECGHMPLNGPQGLIEYLSEAGRQRQTYLVHINNTNPLLVPDTPSVRLPEWIGVASEGMVIEE